MHELAAGVLRHQSELDAVLAPLVPRGWNAVDPALQDVLRIGAFQLTRLDRVPVHAAVSTTVELAREASGPRATGFVNAVLRKVSAGPGLFAESELEQPDGTSAADLATRYSHPEWPHGVWKGELAIGGESWACDDVDPLAFENLHVQQVMRVRRADGRTGIGVLEQFAIGPHGPSGFRDLFDGAP